MITADFVLKDIGLGLSLDFLKREQCWISYENAVCLYMCDFDQKRYQKRYYSELGIRFPQALENSIEKRQAEFLAGRYAARQVISQSGFRRGPVPEIPIGKHRSPVWPPGIKGTIAHNHSTAICAIILDTDQSDRFIGIDIEDYMPSRLATQVSPMICQPNEMSLLMEQGIQEKIAATLIFSAKESLFKALYHFVGDYFGFECAEAKEVSLEDGYLVLDLKRELSWKRGVGTSYKCNFVLEANSLITVIMPENRREY